MTRFEPTVVLSPRRVTAIFRNLALPLLAICVLAVPGPAAGQQTLIHAGGILDVVSGKVQSNMDILIEDGRIKRVGRNLGLDGTGTEIDLRDYTVLPGLIDAHSHIALATDYSSLNPVLYKTNPYRALEALHGAQQALMAGFTTLRDVDNEGADMADIAVREAINDGLFIGPRLVVSGWALSITAGHMNLTGLRPEINRKVDQFAIMTDTRDEMRKAIRDQVKTGVDFIKIYATGTLRHIDRETWEPLAQLSIEEVQYMVNEAARWGKDVAAHAYGGTGAYNAVAGGVRSIEHGMFLDNRTLDLMKKKGTFWSPTMSVYLPGPDDDKETTAFMNEIVRRHKNTFERAMKKKIKIVFGTDIGAMAHGDGWRELQRMADYGMPPIDVIRSATLVGAELLRRGNELGKIKAGYLADLIAVQGRPDRDIAALRTVSFVMVGGIVAKMETH